MKTKQEIKDGIWCGTELESDGWQSTMSYNNFLISLDKYEDALKKSILIDFKKWLSSGDAPFEAFNTDESMVNHYLENR